MNHCLVIGGSGFIGWHLVNVLLAKGRKVTVIGRSPFPRNTLPVEVNYISGDYGDTMLLLEILKDVNEVVDLAYSTVPRTSFQNPINDILSNLPIAINFLKVASKFPIKKIVLISSGGTVYGKAKYLPIKENHPTDPICPYGITKLAMEKYAIMFYRLKSLPIVILRPSNAYGERQRSFSGQGFIATAIASILKKEEVVIFGKNGTIRDYIYVQDICNAILSVLDKGEIGECYNIGSGIGRSNSDVIKEIFTFAKSNGFKVSIKYIPKRKFDVPVNILDTSKIYNRCGWKAMVSFEVGIKKTWDWLYSNNKATDFIYSK